MEMRGFAPEVLELFQTYSWPGNVRELQGAVKQAMLNASGHLILPEFLPDTLRQPEPPAPTLPSGDAFDLVALIDGLLKTTDSLVHEKVIAEVERVLFAKVLQHTHGNQGNACDLLGLNRSTLRHRLRTLGLAVDKLPINKEQIEKP